MNKPLKVEQCIFLSTDFDGHPFIKSIIKEFGPKGYALVTVILLTMGKGGISTVYDQSFKETILRILTDVSQNLLDMVVRKMAKNGFLDREAFYKRKVLTPPERCIMDRIEDVWSNPHDETRPYLFVKNSSHGDGLVNSEETRISSEETIVNTEETTNIGSNFGKTGQITEKP